VLIGHVFVLNLVRHLQTYVSVKIHMYTYKSVCSICSTLYVLNSIKTDDVRIIHLIIRIQQFLGNGGCYSGLVTFKK